MTDKTEEQLADEAVEMFNSLVETFAKQAGRPATKDEMEYIREKVMLHIFGFYEREIVEDGEDKQEQQ